MPLLPRAVRQSNGLDRPLVQLWSSQSTSLSSTRSLPDATFRPVTTRSSEGVKVPNDDPPTPRTTKTSDRDTPGHSDHGTAWPLVAAKRFRYLLPIDWEPHHPTLASNLGHSHRLTYNETFRWILPCIFQITVEAMAGTGFVYHY